MTTSEDTKELAIVAARAAHEKLATDIALIDVPGLETMVRPDDWSSEVDVRTVESLDDIPLADPEPEEEL